MTSLKLLVVNWDALISFLFVSFFCLHSKNLLFNFFFLRCRTPSSYQKCRAWDHGLLASPLKPPVAKFFSTTNYYFSIFPMFQIFGVIPKSLFKGCFRNSKVKFTLTILCSYCVSIYTNVSIINWYWRTETIYVKLINKLINELIILKIVSLIKYFVSLLIHQS